jgi:hypothetical protein
MPEPKSFSKSEPRGCWRPICAENPTGPVSLPTGAYPAYYAGYDFKTIMYNYRANRESALKFMNDFYDCMDTFMGNLAISGPALDIMDNKNYAWPGHGLGDGATTFEYKEASTSAPMNMMPTSGTLDFGFRY